ncbi:hypothetical protein A3Q56_02707 [Intoshia linei]|uniref:Dihydroorotate dehydrogenase (quinone), mitochondrial n=1 Tax=Intoshia linei TaxID=1819745 RepID=A0A177B7D9_9BILA|nr:hypothetical protein A3Q56_02707 [Intoshia linei]
MLKIKPSKLVQIGVGSLVFAFSIGLCKNNKTCWSAVMSVAQMIPAETSHNLTIKLASFKIVPHSKCNEKCERLSNNILNLRFDKPIGLAAGFDKQGQAMGSLLKIGFSFIEVGTITPLPQYGNPKPRLHRLVKNKCILNRFGFNSDGYTAVAERLAKFKSKNTSKPIFVSIGCNKTSIDTDNEITDYVKGYETFCTLADAIVINISSPNTPGLRQIQKSDKLEKIITSIQNLNFVKTPPIFLKLSPDISNEHVEKIANFVMQNSGKCKVEIAGFIISNTTKQRDFDMKNNKEFRKVMKEGYTENGGLSGPPLKNISTGLIRNVHKLTNGKCIIIGVGGVENGQDALDKIESGASLVQIYTSFVYGGPPTVDKINLELDDLLKKKGYNHIRQAIGSRNN